MAAKSKKSHQDPRQLMAELAAQLIQAFDEALVRTDNPNPLKFDKYGMDFFEGFIVHHTDKYLNLRRSFTRISSKILKSKYADEGTIQEIARSSARDYIVNKYKNSEISDKGLEVAAENLVKSVLAEAGKKFIHIEPNYLVQHEVPDIIDLGRVRSMRTNIVADKVAGDFGDFKIKIGRKPVEILGDPYTIYFPLSVWVVDVSATKKNVEEEAKWLIDMAVSLMRLSSDRWMHYPNIGQIEPHPTRGEIERTVITFNEGLAFRSGGKTPHWYFVNDEVISDLGSAKVQSHAKLLFNPREGSLAQSVALGLGWMTRGRQARDRAERLLSFFTALEALLTSSDPSAPVTQTISRYVSIIVTGNLEGRRAVYDVIRNLYAKRSAVVHAGHREVVDQEVSQLQYYVEAVYWFVLGSCDLSMTRQIFLDSLSIASHGERWEFQND